MRKIHLISIFSIVTVCCIFTYFISNKELNKRQNSENSSSTRELKVTKDKREFPVEEKLSTIKKSKENTTNNYKEKNQPILEKEYDIISQAPSHLEKYVELSKKALFTEEEKIEFTLELKNFNKFSKSINLITQKKTQGRDYMERLTFIAQKEVSLGFIQNSLQSVKNTEQENLFFDTAFDFTLNCSSYIEKIKNRVDRLHYMTDCYRVYETLKNTYPKVFDEKVKYEGVYETYPIMDSFLSFYMKNNKT